MQTFANYQEHKVHLMLIWFKVLNTFNLVVALDIKREDHQWLRFLMIPHGQNIQGYFAAIDMFACLAPVFPHFLHYH